MRAPDRRIERKGGEARHVINYFFFINRSRHQDALAIRLCRGTKKMNGVGDFYIYKRRIACVRDRAGN